MPLIFLVCTFGIVALVNYLINLRRSSDLDSFAANFQGQIIKRPTLFKFDFVVEGESHGFPFTLETKTKGGKSKTHHFTFTMDHDFDCGHMKISERGFFSGLGESIGLSSDQKFGRPDIEAKFSTSGSILDLSEFFSNRSRERGVNRLWHLGITELSITPHEIIAYGQNLGYRSNQLSPITTTLGELAASNNPRESNAKQKSVEVDDTPQKAKLVSNPLSCPFCRDVIDLELEAVSNCHDCNTPHHDECFAEASGCGFYACRMNITPGRRVSS